MSDADLDELKTSDKDPFHTRLSAVRARLKKDISALEAELRNRSLVLARLDGLTEGRDMDGLVILEDALNEQAQGARSAALPQKHAKRNKTKDVARHIREVLLEAGRPMRRGAILRELAARGIQVTGADKPFAPCGRV